MKLVARICQVFTSVLSTLSVTTNRWIPGQQVMTGLTPGLNHDISFTSPAQDVSLLVPSDNAPISGPGDGPVYQPPTGTPWDDFACDYSQMGTDWQPCSTPDDRTCWLRNHRTGEEFNIHTDYENLAPTGILRKYELVVTEGQFNADGVRFTQGKLFNGTYNGPWIQACWGDTVEVKVTNYLSYNGTSVHWHGVRQLKTMESDGVNGVTQCAIAPRDSFTYRFKVLQYGSSWYHSHYSLQYADGATGQLTFHGPTSAPFDEAKFPLIMTDWSHDSAFRWAYNTDPLYPSILLNGRGNVTRFNGVKTNLTIPEPYTLHFNKSIVGRPKRYLLRLINTSYRTMFVFSIDNHNLTIVGADFVPIHPYSNSSILIGIGQRYHVIVEANPNSGKTGPSPPSDGNFWIRTWVAGDPGSGCGTRGILDYERTGILRYDPDSKAQPTSSQWPDVSKDCSDEEYSSLVPILKWDVKRPANADGEELGEEFYLSGYHASPNHTFPFTGRTFPLSFFALGANPIRIDYGDPMFTHLHENKKFWDKAWVVVPENYTSEDWVWMVIQAATPFVEAHPIHLHGHDFALLRQVGEAEFSPKDISKFKLDNPPRRDVALLPGNGYIAIAFKTDNPGSWLVHCHIADHAASGLGMQILERQKDASSLWPPGSPAQVEAERVCKNWRAWQEDPSNWWNGTFNNPYVFQDDSGI